MAENIIPVKPFGTNSTMFTQCCGVAICNDQERCPSCEENVIGWDAESDHERGKIRWADATRHWDRKQKS
jgi:hypothetical protein